MLPHPSTSDISDPTIPQSHRTEKRSSIDMSLKMSNSKLKDDTHIVTIKRRNTLSGYLIVDKLHYILQTYKGRGRGGEVCVFVWGGLGEQY